MRFWRRRERLAPARLLRVPGADTRAGLARRRVSPIVSAAVRVSGWRTQVAWLCVSFGAIAALYFVSKIDLHPTSMVEIGTVDRPIGGPLVNGGMLRFNLAADLSRLSDEQALALLGRVPHQPAAPATYDESALGALAFPIAALVVALLMSWKRKQRRLLREGREAEADIRAIGVNGDARAAEVELRFPIAGAANHVGVVAIRPPSWIGTSEPVIYDARRPDLAIALADLPGEPHIVDNALRATRFPLLHFILPGAALGLLVTLAVSVPLALR